jgi:hypothetical protein
MARSEINTEFNTFVGGILTEANPINYPVGYTLDEENFVLERNGTRRRRFGTKLDTSVNDFDTKAAATFVDPSITSIEYSQSYILENGNLDGTSRDLLIVGYNIFHTLFGVQNVVSWGILIYTLDDIDDITGSFLTSYVPPYTSASGYLKTFSRYNGSLIVIATSTSEQHGSRVHKVDWDANAGVISSTNDILRTRNLIGIGSSLSRPSTLSNEHAADLFNQGWLKADVDAWFTFAGNYPSRADSPVFYKDKGTAFSTTYMNNSYQGKSFAPMGDSSAPLFNIYSVWAIWAAVITGGSVPTGDPSGPLFKKDLDGGIIDVTSYGGRNFYLCKASYSNALGSTFIGFNSLSSSIAAFAYCYSLNPPTAEFNNAPTDSDGGYADVSEIGEAVRIKSSRSKLLMFGSSGIHELQVRDGIFKPNDFVLRSVSNTSICYAKTRTATGLHFPSLQSGNVISKSLVTYKDSFLYWSTSGIIALEYNAQADQFVENNLTDSTIKTLYNSIPENCKAYAKGIYTPSDNSILWLYSSDTNNPDRYDYCLVYDLVLRAWYKFKFFKSGTSYIIDCFNSPDQTSLNDTDLFKSVVFIAETSEGKLPMTFSSTSFKDFVGSSDEGEVQGFMQTGYLNANNSALEKQATYIVPSFLRTEDGFTDDGSGNLTPTNQSSCLISAWWDYVDDASLPKANDTFEAYKYNRLYIPSGPADTFDYGQTVLTTKNRLTGRGRALSLRFETSAGKDCKLLGWNLGFGANSKV